MKKPLMPAIFFLFFMVPLLLHPASADPVTVTVGINNVPPTIPYILIDGDDIIRVAFMVNEHNSLYDINRMGIGITIDGRKTQIEWNPVFNKFIMTGFPLAITETILPSGDMSKIGAFEFALIFSPGDFMRIDVFVEIKDRAGQIASCQVLRGAIV